jgi:hypothetical protein
MRELEGIVSDRTELMCGSYFNVEVGDIGRLIADYRDRPDVLAQIVSELREALTTGKLTARNWKQLTDEPYRSDDEFAAALTERLDRIEAAISNPGQN